VLKRFKRKGAAFKKNKRKEGVKTL